MRAKGLGFEVRSGDYGVYGCGYGIRILHFKISHLRLE